MTEDELRKYAAIGIRADISEKAAAAQQAMRKLDGTIAKTGGVMTVVRMTPEIESVMFALAQLRDALQAKEAHLDASIRMQSARTADQEDGQAGPETAR